jgi:hypothetical protein
MNGVYEVDDVTIKVVAGFWRRKVVSRGWPVF